VKAVPGPACGDRPPCSQVGAALTSAPRLGTMGLRREVIAMGTFDRITADPRVMNGQPYIRGMRLTVKRVVSLAAQGLDRAVLREDYPEVEDEDIRQALEYAASMVEDRWAPLPPVGVP